MLQIIHVSFRKAHYQYYVEQKRRLATTHKIRIVSSIIIIIAEAEAEAEEKGANTFYNRRIDNK